MDSIAKPESQSKHSAIPLTPNPSPLKGARGQNQKDVGIARGIAPGIRTTTSLFGQRPYSIHSQRVGASVGDIYNDGPMTQHGFFGAIRSSGASNLFLAVEACRKARTADFLSNRISRLL